MLCSQSPAWHDKDSAYRAAPTELNGARCPSRVPFAHREQQ